MYQAMFNAIRMKAIAANTAPVSINCRSVIPYHQERQRQRKNKSAKTESGDNEAGIGRVRLAARQQKQRHIGKHAVDDDALEEHRAEADFGPRIGEHAAKSCRRGGEIERPRLAASQAAKGEKATPR